MEKGWSWYQLNKEGVFLLPLGSYDFFFCSTVLLQMIDLLLCKCV